jgi:hypothetical protein
MGAEERHDRSELDASIGEIASQSRAFLITYPRTGSPERRIVLTDSRDGEDTQSESAELDADGTLRVCGRDRGRKVSKFFGAGITTYEWVYVLTPGQVGLLLEILDADDDDDVLCALRAFYDRHHGRIHDLLTCPEIAASFSNWHS